MEDTIRKFAWEGLQRNIVMDGDTMIDMRTGAVLVSDVGSTYWKSKSLVLILIVFIDHKITCRRAKGLHILNGTGTLDT